MTTILVEALIHSKLTKIDPTITETTIILTTNLPIRHRPRHHIGIEVITMVIGQMTEDRHVIITAVTIVTMIIIITEVVIIMVIIIETILVGDKVSVVVKIVKKLPINSIRKVLTGASVIIVIIIGIHSVRLNVVIK